MDIKKLIALSESQSLEFKRDASSLEPILKTVIAFANTAGGIILVGVDDGIKPQLIPEFNAINVDQKWVLVIQIEHSYGAYHLTNKEESKGTFIRIGNSNRLASPEMIIEMKRAKLAVSFDKMPCDNVTESELDMVLIHKTLAHKKHSIDQAKLMSLGILTKKGKRVVASNGGVILFGLPETRQSHFPYAEVRCARFAGNTKAEFIDRLNIEGSILQAIDEVPKFIRRNTRMAGKFGGMRRNDIPEYPIEGIREALTNALVHANYEISGTRIFVAIYDDKLEIQNPGIMPPGMSIEQFKAGVSRVRNPVIARVFGELELVEEWGSGYKRIKDSCQLGGYPEPLWEEFGTALRVTFFPHSEVVRELSAEFGTKLAPSWHQAEGWPEQDPDTLNLLKFCSQAHSSLEMMNLLAWQDRTKFRKKYIVPLLEANLLKLTNPDKPNSPLQKYITTETGLALLNKKGL